MADLKPTICSTFTADADDVDDEFGEAASASASDAPAKASDQLFESLSESKTKLLLDDIDDEFGETTIDDVTAKTEAIDEVKKRGNIIAGVKSNVSARNEQKKENEAKSASKAAASSSSSGAADPFDVPQALKRKMFSGSNCAYYPAKITNDGTGRTISYEGTQVIEYPKHSALTAEEQRIFSNFWLQVFASL